MAKAIVVLEPCPSEKIYKFKIYGKFSALSYRKLCAEAFLKLAGSIAILVLAVPAFQAGDYY